MFGSLVAHTTSRFRIWTVTSEAQIPDHSTTTSLFEVCTPGEVYAGRLVAWMLRGLGFRLVGSGLRPWILVGFEELVVSLTFGSFSEKFRQFRTFFRPCRIDFSLEMCAPARHVRHICHDQHPLEISPTTINIHPSWSTAIKTCEARPMSEHHEKGFPSRWESDTSRICAVS